MMLSSANSLSWLDFIYSDKSLNPEKHNYLLHNHTSESVSSAKYLGITLQSDLKWTQHANNIVANANKSILAARRWTISIVLQCSAV
jgi:hypothetical protein